MAPTLKKTDMCFFGLEISRVIDETLSPSRELLHIIHAELDLEQVFIPKVKKR